jgi:hypothetical protein
LERLRRDLDKSHPLMKVTGWLFRFMERTLIDDMSVKLTESITFFERDDWDARPWRTFTNHGWDAHEVFIHHTADTAAGLDTLAEQKARMRGYQNFHMDTRGWSDIAYHAIVFPGFSTDKDSDLEISGRIFQGRPRNHVPAAQENYNSETLAIAVVATGDARMPRSARYAIEVYINYLKDKGAPLKTLGGHRDAPGQATDCPGDGIHDEDLPIIRRATNLKKF